MKKLILAFLLFPIFSFAQVIPNKANQIIVVNNNTAYANFIDVKLLLAKKGIEIANQDKDAFEVTSGLIEVKNAGSSYYLFTCRDNKILITGKNKSNAESNLTDANTTDDYGTIANIGTKGSITKIRFDAMNEFAKLLGFNLKYEISK